MLTEISVDTTGLIYHSSQYGITLIVPEGAVEIKVKIWIGISFVNDKFKFEDNFVPVSPIVWAYTYTIITLQGSHTQTSCMFEYKTTSNAILTITSV